PTSNIQAPAIILLHEYGKDRHEWDPYVQNFVDAGFAVLSYDMRGFGDSRLKSIPANKEAHLAQLPKDLPDVMAYILSQPSINPQHISVIGVGVGANVAFVGSGSHLDIHRTALLVPEALSKSLDGSTVTNFTPE